MTNISFGASSCTESPTAAVVDAKQAVDLGGRFPWSCAGDAMGQQSSEFINCSLALGDIRNNLRATLTIEGGVHLETYLAATGVLAGFAAQRAMFDRLSQLSADRRVGQVMVAVTRAGEKFFFGDLLNDALIARRNEEKRLKIWPLVFEAAISAGMKRPSVPRLEAFFGHVAGQISEPFFPSADRKPAAPGKTLLTLFWPLAHQAFEGELSARMLPGDDPKVVTQQWRPVVLAYMAADCLLEAAKSLPPAKALAILMESAIYGSKVDPAVVEALSA